MQIVVNVYSHYIKCVLRSKAIMFLLLFWYLSQLMLQGFKWRCHTFYTFIYSNNCYSNVKIGQYWQKIQANLACFEEILLFLQWLSILCVNLGLLNVDKQTANAELKAEKSQTTFSVISGQWVGRGSRHIEGVYLTLCLRRTESCKFKIQS